MDEEMLKEELEEHFTNLENIELIASESFKPLYESLVRTLKEYFEGKNNERKQINQIRCSRSSDSRHRRI